jgi:hypothetical protein
MNIYKVPEIKIPFNRIFLLSDVHFGVRNNSIEWLENQLDFFYNFYIPYLKNNVQKNDVFFFF